MATIASLVVSVSANTSDLIRNMRKADSSVSKFGRAAKASIGLVTKAMAAGGLAVTGIAAVSVKAAIEFESSFAGVRKTVEATEEEFDQLERGLRDLAQVIPINVNELNRIAEAAGQLGIKKEAILGFTEVMAKLGVTTNLSAEQASTSLAQLANITGLQQDKFSNLGSTIVDLGNNLATTEAQIVDFGLRIAATGTLAGLTESDILSIGGAMASMGIQAEAGGTAVNKVLLTMTQAVTDGGEELKQFARVAGLSSAQFQEAFALDAANAFTLFVEGLGAQGRQGAATLDSLGLTGIRVKQAFLSLAGAGDDLRVSLERGKQAWVDNTALAKEAQQRFDTFASKIQLLKNKILELAISFGQDLLPAVDVMLAALTGYVSKTDASTTATNGLSRALVVMLEGLNIVQGIVLRVHSGFSGLALGIKLAAKANVDFVASIVKLSLILPDFITVNLGVENALNTLRVASFDLGNEINDLKSSILADKAASESFSITLDAMKAALDRSRQAAAGVKDEVVAFGQAIQIVGPVIVAENAKIAFSFMGIARALALATGQVPPGPLLSGPVAPILAGQGSGQVPGVFQLPGSGGRIPTANNPPGPLGGGFFPGGPGGPGGGGGGGRFIRNAPGVGSPFSFFNSQLSDGGGSSGSGRMTVNITQNTLINNPQAKEEMRQLVTQIMTDVLRSNGVRLQTT